MGKIVEPLDNVSIEIPECGNAFILRKYLPSLILKWLTNKKLIYVCTYTWVHTHAHTNRGDEADVAKW